MAKILVVDDDPGSRQLYVSLLTPFGHKVIEAADGKEGLEQVRLSSPDLIITDILMPTMNGYEFVSSLREYPTMEKVPVIFNSATFLDHETRALGAACGVSLFILKPCEPEKALAVIHEALGLKIEKPVVRSPGQTGNAIPLLIDAFFEKGKQLDSVSSRLASLLELGLDLAHPHDLDALMTKAGNAARNIIGAQYAGIGVLAGYGCHLRSFALLGAESEIASKLVCPVFDGTIFRDIIFEKQARRAFHPLREPEGLELPFSHPEVRGFLGVPLKTSDRTYGWIYVADKLASVEFSEEDAHILTALAAHVALAFENTERLRTIQEHARDLETEVAERKRAEDRFGVLVESAPVAIVIADDKGRITEVNAQGLRMFGYDRRELIGETVEMLLPERARNSHRGHRSGYMKDPRARPMGVGLELFARRKDGTEFPVEISLGPLVTKEGVSVSSTIVDITERKKMEHQLRLAQRMEAVGNLAGGVAHDFNNLLTIIIGSTDLLIDQPQLDPAATKRLKTIRNCAFSGADLTRQLLAFSRHQMIEPRVLDVKEVVGRAQELLGRLIPEDIEIALALEPALGCIKADPGQIEQVLMNLVVNARDAMPKGGRLSIEARNVDLDGYQNDHQVKVAPGRYVMLAVEDTGCGMDRETQLKIFDPFFTTKGLGRGTGLGLATVYGIVKQSGGYIWVYSELSKGTVFRIYLPLIEQSARPVKQNEPEATEPRGSETILIAEDSESLRELAQEYLESLGYTVIEACTGKEALQRARDFEGTIHLLLTDVVMPEMSGPELADQLALIRPGIKVVLTSGYTDNAVVRQALLDSAISFIQKPYRPKALSRKIREVLSTPTNTDTSKCVTPAASNVEGD